MIHSAPVAGRGWRAALVAPLLLLLSCGPPADTEFRFATLAPPHPTPETGAPARFTDSEFIAADGVRLPLRKWLPRGGVKAVILALHGFGDYSHAFETPAQIWAERGIATYAFDQRGFGGAPGHGLWAGTGQLAGDAVTASRILRRIHPGRPLYLLGESMGGAVATLAVAGAVTGAVTGAASAPVAGVRLFPDMVLTGRGLRVMASDNLPMLKELAKDPLVYKGARVDTIHGLVDLMDDAFAAAPRVTAPTLLLYGAHDEVVPRPPIAEFVAHLPPDPGHVKRLAYYAQGYHLLLRDLAGAAVAGDVASWILDRGAPLPSHADAAESAEKWPPPSDRDG